MQIMNILHYQSNKKEHDQDWQWSFGTVPGQNDTIYIFKLQFYKSMISFCRTKNIDCSTLELEYIVMLHQTNQCPSPIPWCWCPLNPDINEWNCIFFKHIRCVSPALGNAVEHAPHTAADLSSQTSFHTLGSQAPGHDVQSWSNEDV